MTDLTKAKIIELVPEIMGLGIGCRVSHFLKGTGTILRVEKHEGESDTYLLGFLALPEPLFEREPRNLNWEILGRPITLPDVLRAIAATEGMFARIDSRGTFEHWWTGDVMNASWERGLVWNLALDYDNQTEVTKRFIGSLIGAV